MASDGIPFVNKLVRGALVQLIEDVIAFIPNIVIFQYNPEKITRSLTPYNPQGSANGGRARAAPDAQPFNPEEKISFTLHLNANEGLSAFNPITMATGVASRIAALRKMVRPTSGLLSDIKGSAMALKNKTSSSLTRPSQPITFLVYGPGLIVPVRITTFSVEENLHTALLYPHDASITMELLVLTPEQFCCSNIKFKDLAISAYNLTKLQEDTLALANIANGVEDIISLFV